MLVSAFFFLSDIRGESDVHGGLDILTKIFRQFLRSQPVDYKIGEGVHLLNTRSENDARANTDDGTVFGAVENYLETHEVRIKLAELMPGEGFGRSFKTAMNEIYGNSNESKFSSILPEMLLV